MITLERTVGRLFELRMDGPANRESQRIFQRRVLEVVPTLEPDKKYVMIVDQRTAGLLPLDLTSDMLLLMRAAHARTERVAVLTDPNDAAKLLQSRRLIEEANFEARKLFTDRREAAVYLAPVLDVAERARLEKFLDEGSRKK
jgi:hypothetical protein